jgi:hypothetical protein
MHTIPLALTDRLCLCGALVHPTPAGYASGGSGAEGGGGGGGGVVPDALPLTGSAGSVARTGGAGTAVGRCRAALGGVGMVKGVAADVEGAWAVLRMAACSAGPARGAS